MDQIIEFAPGIDKIASGGLHLDCTCPGFQYRGNCKHVRDVRTDLFEQPT